MCNSGVSRSVTFGRSAAARVTAEAGVSGSGRGVEGGGLLGGRKSGESRLMKTAPRAVHWRFVPRVMSDRAFWEGVRRSPRHRPRVERLLRVAEEIPPRPTMPAASDYLAARRFNDRGRLDRAWHAWHTSLSALAARRAIVGLPDEAEADQDDRLLDWLWAYLTQPSWVVSAHLPGNDLPASGAPQLDLAACELAAALAEMREVLGPWIDRVSGTLGDTIVAEIDRRVLGPFGAGAEVHWAPKGKPRWMHNWSGVCAGSILAACESLAAQGQPRPEARARAIDVLRHFFEHGFTARGECDEGLGYWSYGVGIATLGLSRLTEEELRRHFDLDRLAQVADYPRRAHLFGDVFLSGNDASLRAEADPGFVPWLGGATGNAWLLQWSAAHPVATPRHFPMILRALSVPDDAWPEPAPLDSGASRASLLEDQQAAVFRVDTPAGEMVATLSGGTNGERHNHNDLGHFMIALGGRLVLPELGNMKYVTDYFGPRRYTYLVASSRGHNCPIVAGQEQRVGAEAAGRVLAWEPEAGRFSLDLTAAYPPEAGLRRWMRTLRREGAGFTLIDEYETDKPGAEIGHVVWSLEAPASATDGEASIEGVWLTLAPVAAAHAVEPHTPEALRMREFTDRRPHRLQWTYRTDDAGRLRVETRIRVKA